MKKTIIAILILLFPSLLFGQLKNGYEIDVTIDGLQDSSIFLAYHFGDKQYIKDTISLSKTGSAKFSGNETLPQGIYMIVLPGNKYFEILISTDQFFSLGCSYSDFFSTLKFAGSEENTAFVAYQKKWISLQQRASALGKRIQNNKQNNDSLKILTPLQKLAEEEMKSYLKGVVSENNGNLLSVLVKAILPIEVPEIRVPVGSTNPDSVKWIQSYLYSKNHFFDNVSFTDERILRTPILFSRLDAFFKNVVIQSPDSINKEIDRIIMKCEKNYKIFQFVAVFLFNHFRESEIMGHDAVVVKLADDIYLSGKADWVSKDFKVDLRKQVDLIRPNLIGRKATDLVMNSYKEIFVSLYDVEKDFTILYFWEPDCGHCKESTPKLKTYYNKPHEYSLEIFAVCTTGEKEKWSKYIDENKLTWINGWDPARSSHFDSYYNVQSTPLIYILDRNKKIIAKKIAVEDIGSFIDNYRKYFN